MTGRKVVNLVVLVIMVVSLLLAGNNPVLAQDPPPPNGSGRTKPERQVITQADRQAAADRAKAAGFKAPAPGAATDEVSAAMGMGTAPHYFSVPNYANSPLPGNIVAEWNAIAQEVVQPATTMPGMPMMSSVSMSEAFVYLAYVQSAVYNALVSIEGGYQPYNSTLPAADPDTSRDAAVAAAAYNVLVHYFPTDTTLAGKYADSLATIPDGPSKTAGVQVGEAAAAEIIALRASDGRGAANTYTIPAPGPGVWQPTMMMADGVTPAPPIDPWVAVMTPFTLTSPSQFRPGPPPDLTSAEWTAQFNEVKQMGSAMSMMRTPAQTEVAKFWGTNGVIQYNDAFRKTAMANGMGLLDTARLLAMGNMVGTDALIACFDSKYTYSFWRPVTAIRNADTDGNPDTAADPNWMPLLMTPNHPEYVAGHACFASAQAEVFTNALGTDQIGIDLSSTITNTTRHYASAADLRQEIVDARTWAGLHYRPSSQLGVTLGQNVAQYALANYFTTAPSTAAHVVFSGGLRKFVDTLPGLDAGKANNLGQYIPVGIADTTTYPGSDYYEIAVVQYEEKMHSDLPPTLLRGYVQLSTSVVPGNQVALTNPDGSPILLPGGARAYGVDKAHYLGPMIVATKDKPVRILFRNLLPTGMDGNLFLPVDTTVMGAGMGPNMSEMAEADPRNPMCGMDPKSRDCYSENRATLHLHGGITPWISDGTPHQWITPAGENTAYPKGVSVQNVPDMPDPGPGAMTFFYTNQQSARLMFYHDHSWGITRLNVYAGESAGYMITDDAEQALIDQGIIPADQIPLIIQDKTFVPSRSQLMTQDPLWDSARWGGYGDLWVPHVYVPAQNPGDSSGVNQYGRWAYGPWFWPPTSNIDFPPIDNPYFDPACDPDVQWCEPQLMPGVPYISMGMESFNDTPVVNGTAYPSTTVEPKSYRLRILNAANDRFWNLQFYKADASGTEVTLDPALVAAALDDPTIFPTPDPATAGPSWIQIGTEGGFLPAPVVIPNQPITWVADPTVFNAGNVDQHSLLLGPAERADVIVDFSQYAGQTLILYNDAPAAFPARDPRYDYYTGNPDLTETGGAPSTIPGYGPNTRTIMQIHVAANPPAPAFNLSALQAAFAHKTDGTGVFESSQNPIIVGQGAYNSAYGTTFKNNGTRSGLVQIYDEYLDFDTLAGVPLRMPLERKAIQDEMGEAFEKEYGRMSGNLGVEAPNAQAGQQQNLILYPFVNPASEVLNGIQISGLDVAPIATTDDGTQIWKITHNGVDTHPIHFHLFDVQLLNRVGWDGIIRKPDANELGWKDTVRISPLEDTIVAMRPILPKAPFGVPDSIRPLNPMMPIGSTAMFNSVDAFGNPIVPGISNQVVNFGWEYVWHCHILSHEEMDMMRPISVNTDRQIATPPTITYARNATTGVVTLNWTDGTPANYNNPASWGSPANEIGFRVERAPVSSRGTVGAYAVIGTRLANQTSYIDNTAVVGSNYRYRVVAYNAAGNSTSVPVGGPSVTLPRAPTTIKTVLQAGPKITLTWRDNATNEVYFLVERSTNGGVYSLVNITPARTSVGTATFVDTKITANQTYQYRVSAVNSGGTSPYGLSPIVVVPTIPAAPSGLSATAVSASRSSTVTLKWTDNSNNETGFIIERATNPSFTVGLKSTTVAANLITVKQTSLYRGVTYYFRIRSTNLGGSSAWSNVFSVVTP